MRKLKSAINSFKNLILTRSPEILLVLFVIGLAPLVIMVALQVYSVIAGAFADRDTFWMVVSEDYWTVAAGVVCVGGSALLLLVIIREWKSLWAVARKMILEALNRKVVLILLLFFVILMPSLPFILETEGSLRSQVQIVLTYSLALAMVLLSVLAIFVCTASVCSEITRKQVHITDTKPRKRWQFLLGKLMGVTILCGVLLFLMSGAVYGLVRYMARERSFAHLPSWEAQERRSDLRRVREEVLVARHTVRARRPDVSEFVERGIEERRARGEITTAAEEQSARRELESRALRRHTTAPPWGQVGFVFYGLNPESDSPVYLRTKPDLTNPRGYLEGGVWIFVRPRRADSRELPVTVYEQQLTPESFQEISIDPRFIDPNGVLRFYYVNRSSDTGVQFDLDGGIEVMQRAGGFTANFYRAVLVVLAHIVLLAAMSIMLGAMFSFPVASFCVASVLVIGLLGPWVAENALVLPPPEAIDTLGLIIRQGIFSMLRGILTIAPQFGRFGPIESIANGRLMSWGYTANAVAVMCFLQGGVAMLLAAFFYWRRELARVIV